MKKRIQYNPSGLYPFLYPLSEETFCKYCGNYWSRTSDPLLVRQVHNTIDAKSIQNEHFILEQTVLMIQEMAVHLKSELDAR